MLSILVVPEFDESLARLCAALQVIQGYRIEPPKLKTVYSVLTFSSGDQPSGVRVLTAPGPDACRQMVDFVTDVKNISRHGSDLPLLVILPPTCRSRGNGLTHSSRWVRTLRKTGVDETLVWAEDETAVQLARRLEPMCPSPFSTDFLQAFSSHLTSNQWLVLGRFLEELAGGMVLSTPDLETASERVPGTLRAPFPRVGTGSFEDWKCRGLIYAVFQLVEKEGMTLRDAALHLGFGHEDFDDVCRTAAGSAVRELEELDGSQELLDRLVERIGALREEAGPEPGRTEALPAPKAEDGSTKPAEFAGLVKRHWSTVRRVARATIRSDHDAQDVAQEVFRRTLGMDANRWSSLSEGFFVRAARNAAVDLLRKRAHEPQKRVVDEVNVPCEKRLPDERVLVAERRCMMRRALGRLPQDRALAVWLRDGRGWKLKEIARLLGRSGDSVQKLIARGKAGLVQEWSGR